MSAWFLSWRDELSLLRVIAQTCEFRIARDGLAYSYKDFVEHYGQGRCQHAWNTVKRQASTELASASGKASLLVLSGQWQDMPVRKCLTESGRLEALATYATQLPKRCIHHQTHFEHFQALLERPMHSLYI